MPEKDRKTNKEEPEKASPVTSEEPKPAEPTPVVPEVKAAPAVSPPPSPVAPATTRPSIPGPFGGRGKELGEAKSDVHTLAQTAGTGSLVLGALKAAYGWTDKTRLTRTEFLRKRDEWLKRPAKEV